MKLNSPGRKRALMVAVTLAAAFSIAACGSDGDSFHAPDAPAPAPTPAPTPVPMADAFFNFVSGIVSTSPDDTEPNGTVESIVATSPEDTEPQPLG